MHPRGCGGHQTPPQPLAGRLAVRLAGSKQAAVQDGWRYRARLAWGAGQQTPAASSGGAAVSDWCTREGSERALRSGCRARSWVKRECLRRSCQRWQRPYLSQRSHGAARWRPPVDRRRYCGGYRGVLSPHHPVGAVQCLSPYHRAVPHSGRQHRAAGGTDQ